MGDSTNASVADPSVITIDNISSRMPPHDIDGAEKSTDHLYALVDMGRYIYIFTSYVLFTSHLVT